MTLYDRCKAWTNRKIYRDGSDPATSLAEFVVSEIGRAQHEDLEDSLPLCLYFKTKEDRDEFIQLVTLAKPDMKLVKVGESN